jgi:hypothetical protein
MLELLKTSDVDAFADSVVAELTERVPLTALRRQSAKVEKRLSRMTEVLSDRVRAFAREKKPSIYQRARLGNRVKWALKDADYPEVFVEEFVTELVTLVTVATKARK